MHGNIVFARTPKGDEEIGTRRYGLDMTRRRVLILIDGKTNVSGILKKGAGLADIEESLGALKKDGFIAGEANLKAELIKLAEEVLGADAEKVLKKIREAPDNVEDLRAASESCKKVVKLIISKDKAEELIERCNKIFEGL